MEVGDVFKSKMGERNYSNRLANCQKMANLRKETRKKETKAIAILDPAAEVLRKQKRHNQKRLTKKRKLDELKPYRIAKRKRRLANQESSDIV